MKKSVVGADFVSALSIDEAVTANGANIQSKNLKTYKWKNPSLEQTLSLLSINEAVTANRASIQIEYKCFKTYKKTKSVVGAAFFSVLSIDHAVTASGANIQTENLKTYKWKNS